MQLRLGGLASATHRHSISDNIVACADCCVSTPAGWGGWLLCGCLSVMLSSAVFFVCPDCPDSYSMSLSDLQVPGHGCTGGFVRHV